LIAFSSASFIGTQAIRRCGPIGWLRGVFGAALMSPQATSPTPSAASRAAAIVRPGARTAPTARPAIRKGVAARSRIPSATTSAAVGSGAGSHSPSGCGGRSGLRSRSNRTVVMSAPETPSTRQWWALLISAKRPPWMPSTHHVSHSGLERSSRWEKIRAASSLSCSSEPGAGSAVVRTW
jgi:hypothetical protein